MKKKILLGTVLAAAIFITSAYAADQGTKEEAVALVKKAVEYIKANGKEKAFAEFTNQQGQFVDRDLYIFVNDFTGKCLAHGQKANMVGKNVIDIKDPDGKAFIKEQIEMMQKQPSAWQDYKFLNPVSKQVETKSVYLERLQDVYVGCGIYKK